MLEWQRDWAQKGTYDAVMDIVRTHLGAYGMGSNTLTHGPWFAGNEVAEYIVPAALAAHK